jgi:hypothetical protein
MYYLLHHSKGTLMLSADDRHQVIEWSVRQLGKGAAMVSVIESEFPDIKDRVEQSGTGIQCWVEHSGTGIQSLIEQSGTGIGQEESNGCRPMMSIMADSAQQLSEVHGEQARCSDLQMEFKFRARQPTWH